MPALSRLLDVKLSEMEKRIIDGVTDWFVKNTIIASQNEAVEGEVGQHSGGGRCLVASPLSNRPRMFSTSPAEAAEERSQVPIISPKKTLRQEFSSGRT